MQRVGSLNRAPRGPGREQRRLIGRSGRLRPYGKDGRRNRRQHGTGRGLREGARRGRSRRRAGRPYPRTLRGGGRGDPGLRRQGHRRGRRRHRRCSSERDARGGDGASRACRRPGQQRWRLLPQAGRRGTAGRVAQRLRHKRARALALRPGRGEAHDPERWGTIINIGSISAMIVNRPQWQPAYNASKAAVHQLTKSLAAEWAPYGVRVNALAPGYIKTEMAPVDEPQFRRHWIEDAPMRRYGMPQELGPSVVFLASDASSFMTGEILVVDGGYSIF